MRWDESFPTSIPSHHLGEDLYSMPSLTVPTPHGKVFHEKFFSTLNAKASTLQVCMCVCTQDSRFKVLLSII